MKMRLKKPLHQLDSYQVLSIVIQSQDSILAKSLPFKRFSYVHQLLQHQFLHLWLKLTLLYLIDLEHRPGDQLLYLCPAMLHRLTIQHDNNELEFIFDEGCRKAGPCRRCHSSLES
ncbi:hypothetical protein FGO68_gene7522 [Halteria grandinella]|uniref:Uncharacterized protein n=1 Tax=Halteria grandinella TaxID=5974 RepID=A0A8J8P0B4_HALGN|nr:hypothetical protein FGO68_gene7522 [Halteria grandinella]